MTIETLNAIKSEAEALDVELDQLGATMADHQSQGNTIPVEVSTAFDDLVTNLGIIMTWVNQAIEDGTVEEPEMQVMAAFLAELKAVFDKYAAVIEHVSSGYGEGMGENYGGASFYRLTATDPVNGNVETKDIVSATLTSEQLV